MLLDGPDDGGVRHEGSSLFASDLNQRLQKDERLQGVRERCEMYVHLFLDNSGLEHLFDAVEYQRMGCAEFPPWSLAFSP